LRQEPSTPSVHSWAARCLPQGKPPQPCHQTEVANAFLQWQWRPRRRPLADRACPVVGNAPGPSFMTCTSFSQARLVSSPWVASSANWAASLASGDGMQGGGGQRGVVVADWGGQVWGGGREAQCARWGVGGPPERQEGCSGQPSPGGRRPAVPCAAGAALESAAGPCITPYPRPPTVDAAGAQAVADGQRNVVLPAQQ
jgi:hypothetical protein